MEKTNVMDITHSDYQETIDQVYLIRDSIEGSNSIKNGDRSGNYLMDPVDDDSKRQSRSSYVTDKFKNYKMRAEFESFPAKTESGYMGSLSSTLPEYAEIPSAIEYLMDDSDGNGLSINESIEITQANLLEVKYHGLLADFSVLDDADIQPLTAKQADDMGLKATIKHYPRETILDWDYSLFDGKKMLSFVKVQENSSYVDKGTFKTVTKERQLVLGLNDKQQYYQQSITKDDEGKEVIGEPVFVSNNSGVMNFIPFEFVIDQKIKSMDIPRGFGILYPICLKAIYRYQVSADLKESIHRTAMPTSYSTGWTTAKYESYKKMTGKETICIGSDSHIPLPDGAEIGYLQWDADSNAMFKYMEINQKEAKAMGARFDTSDARDETVGVAMLRSSEELSALINIQSAVESAYIKVLGWCFDFMSRVDSNMKIELNLNREFNKIKISPQEQKEIRDNVTMGIYSKIEGLRLLEQGGVLTDEAEIILNEATTMEE